MTTAASHEGSKPPCLREDALAVLMRLREAGQVAYFAGGCVRDELLGLTPKDYDVATDAPPDRVRKLFTNTQAVGAAFGVILVRHRRSAVEVATFRTDGRYVDGRRPEAVTFTTAEEDAKRRDFTINGLFLDPVENRVIDYVGGQEDLKNRVLRAIGNPDQRFEEDHLRLLRAVRFAARFALTLDPRTAAAIASHALHLQRISPERVGEELRLILTPPTRVAAWELLWALELLPVIFRAMPEWATRPLPRDRYGGPLFPELSPQHTIPFGLALAALAFCYRSSAANGSSLFLLERGEIRRAVQACRTTLKISNDEAELMSACLDVAELLRADPPTVATMKRFLAKPSSRYARQFLEALLHAQTSHTRIIWLREQFEELDRGDVAPAPLVTGDDLTDAGLNPGPRFKIALDQTYDAQLEDRVTTRDAALQMAVEIARGKT